MKYALPSLALELRATTVMKETLFDFNAIIRFYKILFKI